MFVYKICKSRDKHFLMFYTLLTFSNDVNKFCDVIASTLIAWPDMFLEEAFLEVHTTYNSVIKLEHIISYLFSGAIGRMS